MNYSQAIDIVLRQRQSDLTAAENAYLSALERHMELSMADAAYRQAVLSSIKTNKITEVEQAKQALDGLLKRLDLYEAVYPPFRCSKCNDSGFFEGGYCSCVRSLVFGDEQICLPLNDFNDIDLSMFDEKGGAVVSKTKSFLKKFCGRFPQTATKSIMLMGNSGTGKTFLASCTANELLKKGSSVVFITAFEFVCRAAKYHTTFDESRERDFRPLLDCDMLILDDLGTEAVYKNITLEYLYVVLSDRLIRGRHTLITSNLSVNELYNRYGDRIASRLFDRKTGYASEFSFGDIRAVNVGQKQKNNKAH